MNATMTASDNLQIMLTDSQYRNSCKLVGCLLMRLLQSASKGHALGAGCVVECWGGSEVGGGGGGGAGDWRVSFSAGATGPRTDYLRYKGCVCVLH